MVFRLWKGGGGGGGRERQLFVILFANMKRRIVYLNALKYLLSITICSEKKLLFGCSFSFHKEEIVPHLSHSLTKMNELLFWCVCIALL